MTVLGEATSRGPVLRSGALVGDWILVTGPLGGSILGHHLDFVPRVCEALRLHGAADLHAMIDLSDGLVIDLVRLCRASRVGAEIDADRLPLSPILVRLAGALGMPVSNWFLRGGEDYELLCSAPPGRTPRLRREMAAVGTPLHDIGCVIPEPGLWLRSGGRRRRLVTGGFDTFAAGADRASVAGGASSAGARLRRSGPACAAAAGCKEWRRAWTERARGHCS